MNRRFIVVALLGCLAFSMALIFAPVTEARCRPPQISISASEGARGMAVTVTGERFYAVCHDVDDLIGKPMAGAKNIKILLKQGDRSSLLATLDADSNLRFSTAVTIPRNADLGRATIIAEADAYANYEKDSDRPNPLAFEVVASGEQ